MTTVGLRSARPRSGRSSPLLIFDYGWRESFYVLAPLGVLVGPGGTGTRATGPRSIRAITARRCALIDAGAPSRPAPSARRVAPMLVQRDVLLLAASYFCMNYVFYMFAQWLFTYLVEERGFSLPRERMALRAAVRTGAGSRSSAGSSAMAVPTRSARAWAAAWPAITGLLLVAVLLPPAPTRPIRTSRWSCSRSASASRSSPTALSGRRRPMSPARTLEPRPAC